MIKKKLPWYGKTSESISRLQHIASTSTSRRNALQYSMSRAHANNILGHSGHGRLVTSYSISREGHVPI